MDEGKNVYIARKLNFAFTLRILNSSYLITNDSAWIHATEYFRGMPTRQNNLFFLWAFQRCRSISTAYSSLKNIKDLSKYWYFYRMATRKRYFNLNCAQIIFLFKTLDFGIMPKLTFKVNDCTALYF